MWKENPAPTGKPKGRPTNYLTEEQIREVYHTATSITHACKILGVSSATYKKYAAKYGFNLRSVAKPPRMILESEIKAVHEIATSAIDAARKLGRTFYTYRKYAKMYGLYDEILKRKRQNKSRKTFPPKIPIEDLLAGKHQNYPIAYFKERLFRSGLKNRSCEICNYNERRVTDGLSPLVICFLDGNKKNWALNNIKIICFNCSFVTDKINSFKERVEKKTKVPSRRKPMYDRCRWESNGEKWSSYVLERQKIATEETKGKDVDITNIHEISDEELDAIKNEVKNEIKN